jgi:hypothetical protein
MFVWFAIQGSMELQAGIETIIMALLIIGLPLGLTFSVWRNSVPAKITVDNTGVSWTHGKQYTYYPWEHITAAFVHWGPAPVIHIWGEKEKGEKFSLNYFDQDNKIAITDTINKQAFARTIPFNIG